MTSTIARDGAQRPLGSALATSLVATAASFWLPDSMAGAGVGLVFLAATWWLVLRNRDADARAWGLSLGGLLDGGATPWRETIVAIVRAIGFAALVGAVIFPPFVYAFVHWWHVRHLAWRAPAAFGDVVLSQLVVVALPEEAFFRGYLQTALDRVWTPRARILGADLGPSVVVTSVVFALGHLATVHDPARLAVFFPSLLFGWMRARTGGIGAGVVFHAACNLLSDGLARGSF